MLNQKCEDTYDMFDDHEITPSMQTKKAKTVLEKLDVSLDKILGVNGRAKESRNLIIGKDDFNTLKISANKELEGCKYRPKHFNYRGYRLKTV